MYILANICTKGRTTTTLPLTLMSLINQTRRPNEILIYDDNDNPIDLRSIEEYGFIFKLMTHYNIKWQVVYGRKLGQHYGHQLANEMAMKNNALCARLDDDEVMEPNVIEILERHFIDNPKVGAVGGLVIVPPASNKPHNADNKINNLSLPNIQWFKWEGSPVYVEHLHSSFMYRSGIADYDLRLSPKAHREETLFTYNILKAGYELIVDPKAITWHFRSSSGGIRIPTTWNNLNDQGQFEHDEKIFRENIGKINKIEPNTKYIHLDNGLGDHICFSSILPDLRKRYSKIVIACCFPDVFAGEKDITLTSIAASPVINPSSHNIYKFMIDRNWNKSLAEAFRAMYLPEEEAGVVYVR